MLLVKTFLAESMVNPKSAADDTSSIVLGLFTTEALPKLTPVWRLALQTCDHVMGSPHDYPHRSAFPGTSPAGKHWRNYSCGRNYSCHPPR